jgi:hypothetical protein
MRFPANKHCRRVCCFAVLVLLGFVGLCIYVVATRSPIGVAGFQKLRLKMNRAEVEHLLGGPATGIVDLRATPDILEFDTKITYVPRKPPKLGDASGKVLELTPPIADIRPVAEQHIWEGPEGSLGVLFDQEERLAAASFVERVTWRTKLREWLPWLP